MTIEIPRPLIEYILLGSGDSRRQLQDSPILGDVWVRYSEQPKAAADLLITSHKDTNARELAKAIYDGIGERPSWADDDPAIAPLQTFVAARLYFEELLRVVVPMTKWWHEPRTQAELEQYRTPDSAADLDGPAKLNQAVDDIAELLKHWSAGAKSTPTPNQRSAFERFVALCALVFLAGESLPPAVAEIAPDGTAPNMSATEVKQMTDEAVEKLKQSSRTDISRAVFEALNTMNLEPRSEPMVFQISLNRRATAGDRQIRAHRQGRCGASALRSGLQQNQLGDHRFGNRLARIPRSTASSSKAHTTSVTIAASSASATTKNRCAKRISSASRRRAVTTPRRRRSGSSPRSRKVPSRASRCGGIWSRSSSNSRTRRQPVSEHGTHVAGIIGAAKRDDDAESADGMCPGIGLYDFRILSADLIDTEFAVIAALQFIRYTNEQAGFLLINGVNLSLSIPHDVRNYACGGTPICAESERLIDNGVVVVAAAGNLGYQHNMIGGQAFDNYNAFSITDPGNAERVITVGSTHRYAPLTYGVSYFSSRGPTGDGRFKPDLVAPGERINGPLPKCRWGCLDGTSMAAPHVSGAAAMLMARYPELIGKPDKVKRILCENATDLGRERSFQGRGMLDVLRALQSQ